MPLEFGFLGKKKTIEEIQEDNERLRIQAENEDYARNIALSQAERQRLANAGLTVRKDFGGSVVRALKWLNKSK